MAENIPSSGSTHSASCETAASPVQTPHNLATAFGAQGQQPSIFGTEIATAELQTEITTLRKRIKVLEASVVEFKTITQNQTQAIRNHEQHMASVHKSHDAANTALKEEVDALKAAVIHTIHRLADTENRQEQYDATMRQLGQTLMALADSVTELDEDVGI